MAREEIVTFEVEGEAVVGTLRLAGGNASPVVLLLHGFAGTRDELATPALGMGIFAYVAERLETLGFSSLRIDFRGSGESGGRFADTTYSCQIADCVAAMEFIAAHPAIDPSRLYLLGWSQGGLVAAVTAGQTNRPAGIALWAAVGEPAVSFPTLIGQEAYQRGLASDRPVDIQMPWGASLTLGPAFFAEVAAMDPLTHIAAYRGPAFFAEGTLDRAIAVGTAGKFAAAHRGPQELWTAPMDHAFNSGTTRETLDDLIAATAAFFTRTPAT
ncbi:alpha/beta hydrolase family protein [Lacibacterium aquatile]|uniref:Alpha/beta hydrolase family protein n=1 Tax=Lacibacterium aquatile TaxID=1168082 RepID=A0ABW5DX38_9PROT